MEVAHPGAAGLLTLAGAVVATLVAALGARAITLSTWDAVRGRGWNLESGPAVLGMMRFLEMASGFAGFALPILAPLTAVHLAGWFDVWSSAGALLAVALGAVSATATALMSHLHR